MIDWVVAGFWFQVGKAVASLVPILAIASVVFIVWVAACLLDYLSRWRARKGKKRNADAVTEGR
jgi:hypothetical protein